MTRRETRRTRRVRWLAALLGAFVLALSIMPVTAWADEIEVGEGESLYDVVKRAKNDDTIKLTSDITLTKYVFVEKKSITIDGGGYTITRSENFTEEGDLGRGGYNPAMIEVANGAELRLENVTLDDAFRTEGTEFELAGDSSVDNSDKVHDGIIASYGDGHSTIVLGKGTTLKNFGGLSAVYITGEDGDGATLVMESGSKICDGSADSRKGGYAAIFNHGGTVRIESGASIEGIDGRAVYIDNAGATTVNGTIEGITTNDLMVHSTDVGPSGSSTHFGGIVAYVDGNSVFRLGETGAIRNIKSYNDDQVDTLFYLHGGKLETAEGSLIDGIQIVGLVDSNGGETEVAGTISNCATRNVLFRLRGTQGSFFLRESGRIVDNQTTDSGGLLYLNGGKPTIEIAGTIDTFNKPALYISNNGSRKDGTITVTEAGVITNVKGDAIKATDPSTVTIRGAITNCSGYAVEYEPKGTGSLLKIEGSAHIAGNHNGGAQIAVKGSLTATDASEHAEIAPGSIEGNTTIDLPPFDVTLDEDYAPVKLGNASDSAVEKIEQYVASKDSKWEVVGSDAVWLEPSGESVHFVASGLNPAPKNTGLYVAYVELDASGDPVVDAAVSTLPVDNSDDIDVTLTGLKAGTAYAVMFFNNAEYTLAPDDVTIYTGGGQGDEEYDNGGFPALTIDGSVDPIESLEIGDDEKLEGDEAMRALLGLLDVAYYDGETQIRDDSVAGEYRAVLSWKSGQKPDAITINGNEVSGTFDEGTLVVRYVEDVDGAQGGTSTHGLLTGEPDGAVEHAEAIAKKGGASGADAPEFYTNGDEGRQAGAAGVRLLDDGLLADEDGTDRQALLEDRAEETVLGDPGEGQAWRYEFRYLDLVDAHNGNAWVSASYGTTVYLPYPDGMTYDEAKDIDFEVVHFPGLHREYGFSGRDEVEDAIAACAPEAVDGITLTEAGIRFDVDSAGFSPFAVAWRTEARTITATADGGSTVTPSGTFTVPVDEGMTFAVAARAGYAIEDVTLDGASVLDRVSSGRVTVPASRANQALRVTSRSTSGGGGSVTPSERYTITATAGEGGSISPSGTRSYAAGSDVTFTIAPDEGWTVGDVTVDGVSYRQLGSYTFEDLDDDHTISVTFMRGSDPLSPDETGVSDWLNASDHVAYLHGYGDGSGKFGPENPMTRAEVAQMFYNLLLDKSMGDRDVAFEDVPEGAYYEEAVITLASRGILNGTSPETFEPNRAITRAEFVAIAMRFSDGAPDGENPYVDVPEDAWYRDYVVGATSFGWIYGYQDGSGRFGPDDTITRGQATMVTNRMLWRSCDTVWATEHLDELRTFVDLPQGHYAFFDVVEATNAHDYERVGGTRFEDWTGLRE